MANQIEKKTKIEMTYNYKQFKFIKGNRPLVTSKVTKLVKSYNGGLNLFPYCPILINNDFYVIDGQHRLEACKRLNISVYYIVIPEVTLQQIAELNATATRWKVSDFFNCFIQTGNQDYVTLQTFKDRFGLSINTALQLLMVGSCKEGGGHCGEAFRLGQFKINHLERANKIMKHVFDYREVASPEALSDRNFIIAIQVLLSSPLYKHKEMIQRLTAKKLNIVKKYNYKEYIYHMEELFNRNNSKRYFIYEAPKQKK